MAVPFGPVGGRYWTQVSTLVVGVDAVLVGTYRTKSKLETTTKDAIATTRAARLCARERSLTATSYRSLPPAIYVLEGPFSTVWDRTSLRRHFHWSVFMGHAVFRHKPDGTLRALSSGIEFCCRNCKTSIRVPRVGFEPRLIGFKNSEKQGTTNQTARMRA